MGTETRNIILTERDKKLLEGIRDHLFMPAEVAEQYLFSGVARATFNRRKQKLIDRNLIKAEQLLVRATRPILRLTRQGFDIAIEGYPHELSFNQKVDIRNYEHDSLVMKVRFRLQHFLDAEWLPERIFKDKNVARIPDGVLRFPDKKMIAVEIENTPKGAKRFNEIQRTWQKSQFAGVIYIASTRGLFDSLQKYMKAGPQDDLFGLFCWPELETEKPKLWKTKGMFDLLARRTL